MLGAGYAGCVACAVVYGDGYVSMCMLVWVVVVVPRLNAEALLENDARAR